MGGQNDKVLLKIFKLFRIIPKKKKKILKFFDKFGGRGEGPLGPIDGPPLDASCHRR